MNNKLKIQDILDLKGKRKITMLTAYDYPMGQIIDEAGIDMILVGDSLANVVLGLESTTQVGMFEMLHHCKAVSRAVKNALVIGDMPYESYQSLPDGRQVNSSQALENARRFIDEAACDAVKLEWFEKCLEVTSHIIKAGISVMGHIGLTPQTASSLGGFKVQGKDAAKAKELIRQAKDLEDLGCFSIVLECVPDKVAEIITGQLKIPTIGIGAGGACDGQVLVTHDLAGLFKRFRPKFVKQYIDLSSLIQDAVKKYKAEVINGEFPSEAHTFKMSQEELGKLGF